jgi:hypothetical protein
MTVSGCLPPLRKLCSLALKSPPQAKAYRHEAPLAAVITALQGDLAEIAL